MRFIILLLITMTLYSNTFNFNEYRFVYAVGTTFKKSGTITIDNRAITISYKKPNFKKIISDGENIGIEDESGDVKQLKGRALLYTKQYLDLIINVESVKELKSNENFDVEMKDNIQTLYPKNEMKRQLEKIEVKRVNGEISEFKMFMSNSDTVEIIKE